MDLVREREISISLEKEKKTYESVVLREKERVIIASSYVFLCDRKRENFWKDR